MSESENRAANWTMGLVGSIVLHVAVIGLFVMLGGPRAATEPDGADAPPAPSVVEPVPSDDPPAPSVPPPTPAARPAAPAHPVTSGQPAATAPRPDPVRPRVEPVTPPAPRAEAGPKFYVVQRGDYANKIAQKHNLTLQQLASLNGMTVKSLNGLAIGQKLKVAE